MTFKELSILVSKFEGKKKQVNLAQIREILSVLSELMCQSPNQLAAVINALVGDESTAKRKAKK